MTEIPPNHPRYHSLRLRDRLLNGLKSGVATEAGLLAHGRGEAFDYLLGENSHDFAIDAIAVASALFRCAKRPVFSVNGSSASLAGPEIIELTKAYQPITLEVNLFYHSQLRSERVASHLRALGATCVVESATDPTVRLSTVTSARGNMNPEGLATADVILVALEDGDRCRALIEAGRTVIAIDLNPKSRTAQVASVTIIDELTRAVKLLTDQIAKDSEVSKEEFIRRVKAYDNRVVLNRAIQAIRDGV